MKGTNSEASLRDRADKLQASIIFLFLFPLFFRFSGSIFSDRTFIYESHGKLMLLPLPLAIILCFVGIGLLLRLENRHFGVGFVFSSFALMAFCTLMSSGGIGKAEFRKFIQLIQFVLPMFALVLGSLYVKPRSIYLRYEALALYILLIVVPLEMIATFDRGSILLNPYLYVFSLYQHLQYLPVVFVALYFLAALALCKQIYLRYLIIFLAPWMGLYVAASLSSLATGLAFVCSLTMLVLLARSAYRWYAVIVVLVLSVGFLFYYPTVQSSSTYKDKYGVLSVNSEKYEVSRKSMVDGDIMRGEEEDSVLPKNIRIRLDYWKIYSGEITKTPETLLFGSQAELDRKIYPSAHNYYLDLAYNFGVISVIPIVFLIFTTVINFWRAVRDNILTTELVMLALVVFFVVFVDNAFKVGFRQPYPGMVMFFLWGVLLSFIQQKKTE